jgi:hypothetical protein
MPFLAAASQQQAQPNSTILAEQLESSMLNLTS